MKYEIEISIEGWAMRKERGRVRTSRSNERNRMKLGKSEKEGE